MAYDYPQWAYSGWNPEAAQQDWQAKGKNEQALIQVRGYGPSGASATSVNADDELTRQAAQIISELDSKLSNLRITLTNSERDAFLQKAIDQITPYYDKKKAEIEKGIQEGKIRTAEDVLASIRDIQQTTETLLAKYDVTKARTDEELVNTLADITATSEEDLAMKRDDWRQRIDTAKQTQVQKDILTSGIGQKEIGNLQARQQLEEGAIQRRAGADITKAQTGAKYDLQTIALSRQAAEQERVRQIGTPEQQGATTQTALGTLGYTGMEQLPSQQQLALQRGLNPTTLYSPEALTTSEEERKRATESRRMELESGETAKRAAEYEAAKRAALTSAAKSSGNLSLYLGGI